MTETIKAALLDVNDVYQGMVVVPTDQLTDRHLPEITECDLPPFRYRWNHTRKAFEAIKGAGPLDVPPDATRAIAAGLTALFQNKPCPPETAAWLKAYANSFDFKGK